MQHLAFNYMLKRAKFLFRLCGFRATSIHLGRTCALFQLPQPPPSFVPLKKIFGSP